MKTRIMKKLKQISKIYNTGITGTKIATQSHSNQEVRTKIRDRDTFSKLYVWSIFLSVLEQYLRMAVLYTSSYITQCYAIDH